VTAARRASRRIARGPALAALAALVALTLTACPQDDKAVDVPFPGDTGTTLGSAKAVAPGLSIRLPAGWKVDVVEAPTGIPTECAAPTSRWSYHETLVAAAALPPKGACHRARREQPLNGKHGLYLSADDALHPRHVLRGKAPGGATTVFDQDYTECTNSCRTTVDRVGLLRLTDPTNPERPVLMLWGPADVVSVAQMLALLRAVQPA
jgi:hypothetical protein